MYKLDYYNSKKVKRNIFFVLLLLIMLNFSGCNDTMEAKERCNVSINGNVICQVNISYITGNDNYLEYNIPKNMTSVLLDIHLYEKKGNLDIWILNPSNEIVPLVAGHLSGESKVEKNLFRDTVFRVYLEPHRNFLLKKATDINMTVHYKIIKK